MIWTHDGLAADLAEHLRVNTARLVWENMQMGPSGSPRPDVFTLFKSWSRPLPTAYEIKVSRADFLADVNAGKWQKYLDFAGTVIFAVPKSLIKRDEVPAACGLIVRSDKIWRTTKGAPYTPTELPEAALLKLLIDGIDRLTHTIGPRQARIWDAARLERRGLAKDVAAAAVNLAQARVYAEKVAAEAAEIIAEARRTRDDIARQLAADTDTVRQKIAAALGMPESISLSNLADNLDRHFAGREASLSADCEIKRLTVLIDQILDCLKSAGRRPPPVPYWQLPKVTA
ncbi:hypothetical protein LCGC14_0354790 [marine sediment metagenome]|uniref:MmcB family DNA repair protein n=1 Tax=marine sediment metagenome TaxID=412755 RepID=A0A0F9TF90_9ZZZZ